MTTIKRAPNPKEFAAAWTRGFAKAVRDAGGTDGRLSDKEAGRMDARYADNAKNYLDRTGQKTVAIEKLIAKAHDYAYAVADKAAGSDGRVSLEDGKKLPADIRGDFFALRGREEAKEKLAGAALVDAFEKATTLPDGTVLNYMSESDYPVLPVRADNPTGKVDGETVMKLFEDLLTDGVFEDVGDFRGELTAEAYTKKQSAAIIASLGTFEDGDDDYYRTQADGFARVGALLADNLKDVRVVKVGPKDDDGSLASDSGLYAYFLVGNTADGQLAGVYYGSVET